MTPRQKALQLVDSFTQIDQFTIGGQKIYFHDSIKCALIAVDEMIFVLVSIFDTSDSFIDNPILANFVDKRITYLEEVKQEIEKL